MNSTNCDISAKASLPNKEVMLATGSPSCESISTYFTSSVDFTQSLSFQIDDSHGFKVIIIAIIEILLMIVICLGNSMVIFIIWRSTRLHNFTYYFIVQLAIADMAVGLMLPFQMILLFNEELMRNIFVCILRYTLYIGPMVTSLLSLTLMTFDR